MITAGKGGIYLDLQVQPNARRPGVRGIHGDRLKIAVQQPAESGKANQAAIAVAADLLEVPPRAVSLVGGHTSRRKRVHVEGVDSADARRLINAALDEGRA